MERPGRRRAALGALLAVILLLALLAAVGAIGIPTVTAVDSEWGTVTDETAEVRVAVDVHNPNPVAIPPLIRLAYVTRLNEVVVASGRTGRLGFPPGDSTIRFSMQVANDRIDDWWITHVNGGERSMMVIDAGVELPLGLAIPAATERMPIETAFVDSVTGGGESVVAVAGERFVVIGNETASWGEATEETTPVTFSASLENAHDDAIAFDGLGYTVRMNDVVLGEGVTEERVRIAPGETGTLAVDAALDTGTIPTWWVSHLRAGERTTLTVTLLGLVDTDGGEPVALPLLERRAIITTDLLDTGVSTVEPVETAGPVLDVAPPTIGATTLAWGTVTDETTDVEASIAVDAPDQDSPLAGLVTVRIGHAVAINDVPVASGATDVGSLPVGEGTIDLTASLDNARVPAW